MGWGSDADRGQGLLESGLAGAKRGGGRSGVGSGRGTWVARSSASGRAGLQRFEDGTGMCYYYYLFFIPHPPTLTHTQDKDKKCATAHKQDWSGLARPEAARQMASFRRERRTGGEAETATPDGNFWTALPRRERASGSVRWDCLGLFFGCCGCGCCEPATGMLLV